MSFIRTVLGDIPARDLGVCYAHEHIFIDRSFTTFSSPDFLLDSVPLAVAELREFHAAGGRAMVDSMPCDSGRNVASLAAISRAAGVHIVAPTGLHLAKYYPPGHWGERLGANALARLFIADILEGADANDYGGPAIERLPHRCGVIKIASGLDRIDAREEKVFEAAAEAHHETGAPILTHTEQGTAAIEQVRLLHRLGVDPAHVVLSHTDRRADRDYHREILSTGVFVEFDSGFRWKPGQGNPTRDLVVFLFEQGLGAQVLLGMDAARRSYWKHYGGGPGLTFLLKDFAESLRAAGLSAANLEAIFVANPARAFRFRVPA